MRRVTALSITERQRKSIAAAIASGLTITELVSSGRFPGVSKDKVAEIADAASVARTRRRRLRRDARSAR